MTHDVFISYSHHDKPEADAVCATLEARGVRCWVAPRDIVPGQEWGEAIVDAIRSSAVMVLVFSQHANDSPQIRREVERAVHEETVLIPFRIEDVVPERALEYFLSAPHWLDALTAPLEAHLERLAAAVGSFLEQRDAPGSEAKLRHGERPTPATDGDIPAPAVSLGGGQESSETAESEPDEDSNHRVSGLNAADNQTEFDVYLEAPNGKKITVIKVTREIISGLGLKETKDLLDSAPVRLLRRVSKVITESVEGGCRSGQAKA